MIPIRISYFNPATLTALAAIFGSLVGALGSSIGAWLTQRHQGRSELLAKKIFHREQLYSDFISESARLLVDALETNTIDPKNMIPAYALLSRIRLCSPPRVLAAAEDVLKHIIETYPKPNLTPEQIREETVKGVDPLKSFSEICRNELELVQRQF